MFQSPETNQKPGGSGQNKTPRVAVAKRALASNTIDYPTVATDIARYEVLIPLSREPQDTKTNVLVVKVIMAGTRKLDISTLGESSDQACLDNIWQELTETPELIDALNMIGDPQSFKSAFEDAALAHKETTGSFPSSRTATIVTLDKSGDSFGESAESGRDCLFDLSITCRHQCQSDYANSDFLFSRGERRKRP
ncbi:hypothetical protein BDV93DRAFT_507397 [Ceratobasidium sp. AG-I]|nr:hypothetical protein BDV93DRAFT_507397 [Ceratobasidium sp. AG-I]